jgi:adenylate cyclase
MADGTQRRLTTIMAADIAGFSRLVGIDEEETLAAQRGHRSELIEPLLAKHHGRIANTAGDSFLIEFDSAVEAVRCAIAVQDGMTERNRDIPADRRIEYRVGINVGDVVADGDDLLGDGVNIAARLEALADAGGVCISQTVLEHVRDRIDVSFDDLGEVEVKNIARPPRVWRWSKAGRVETPTVVIVGESETSVQSQKPSIAVLPFDNMSGDIEQEYFSDGITEDIITALQRIRQIFVMARNTSFTFKGHAVDVQTVARELSVRYVLEGSVRKSGQRVRITAQLIDAESGNHIWAERFDRDLEDIFALQDEVTEAIVAAIAPEISEVERNRAQRKPPGTLDAWDLFQRALAAYYSSTEVGMTSAIEQFDAVSRMDPTFAPAFAMAAAARWRYALHFQPDDSEKILQQALDKSYFAVKLDPRDPTGLWNAAEAHSILGQHDVAVGKAEEAVALNPTDAITHFFLGSVLSRAGRAEEAIPHMDRAMRLSPKDIWMTGMITERAFVLFHLERYEEAFGWAQRARLSPNPRTMTFAVFAALLAKLGRDDEARTAVQDLLAHTPGLTFTKYRENRFGPPATMERLAGALRDAGLPE